MNTEAPPSPDDPRDAAVEKPRRRRTLARAGNILLWYVLPGLVVLAVVGYIGEATIGHVNPPVVPVEGVSMRPTLQAGDLIFLEGVDPKTLRKGDIVAVNVPAAARKKYNLPAHIVHRIVKIGHDAQGLAFTTKGDANSGADVFTTHSGDVIGKVWFKATGLGYPFLFFRSRQGEIFLGAAALLALLYFGLGVIEERRIVVEGTAVTMQSVLEETQVLRDAISHVEMLRGPPAGGVAPVVTPQGTPVHSPELDDLIEEVRDANANSRETSEVMRELVGAIGEYGTHLKSHTEVMTNLAATTGELQQATVAMRHAIAGDTGAATPAEVAPPSPPALSPAAPPSPPVPDPLPPAADATPRFVLKRALRGYARESVEALLEEMAQRVSRAEQRLTELGQSHAHLQADRDRLDAEVAKYRHLEQSIAETLSRAEETAAEITRRAEQDAERMIEAARASAAATPTTGEQRPSAESERRHIDVLGECVYLPE